MPKYVIEVVTSQELSDWELDELNQTVVDWMTMDGDDDLSVTTTEGE